MWRRQDFRRFRRSPRPPGRPQELSSVLLARLFQKPHAAARFPRAKFGVPGLRSGTEIDGWGR